MSLVSFRQLVNASTQFGNVVGAGRIQISTEIGQFTGDVWIESLSYATTGVTPGTFQAWLIPQGEDATSLKRITLAQLTQAELTAGGFPTTSFTTTRRFIVPRSLSGLWDVLCVTTGKADAAGLNMVVTLDPTVPVV